VAKSDDTKRSEMIKLLCRVAEPTKSLGNEMAEEIWCW